MEHDVPCVPAPSAPVSHAGARQRACLCDFLRNVFTVAPVGWARCLRCFLSRAVIAVLRPSPQGEKPVLTWAIILAIVSLIAGWLGFGTLSGIAGTIAKILFVIFVILFVLALLGVLGVLSIF
ncbi:DUF1328 domain-containing protein [Frateuria sp. GZRR33]|uniref:DUF1328 domain-containing protein n=1 Tax=Frateuria sp. GZRR33 TaxID=3351535 RepID=UPI003F73521C